jgi:hypothetical protein
MEKNYIGKENMNLDPGEESRDKREAGIQKHGVKLGRASGDSQGREQWTNIRWDG